MWQMKNITFQAGQRLAFIIVLGVGGGRTGCPKGEGGVPTCRLQPIDLGRQPLALFYSSRSGWGFAQTQPSITATPSGCHHPWHYANKIICLLGGFFGELQWWGGRMKEEGVFAWDSSFQPISLSRCRIKFKTLIKTIMKARRSNSVTPGGAPPSAHTKAILESKMSAPPADAPPAACYATPTTFPPLPPPLPPLLTAWC